MTPRSVDCSDTSGAIVSKGSDFCRVLLLNILLRDNKKIWKV